MISALKTPNIVKICQSLLKRIVSYKGCNLPFCQGELNYRDTGIEAFKIEDMAQLLQLLVGDKTIESSGIQIIRTVLDEGGCPDRIMESE